MKSIEKRILLTLMMTTVAACGGIEDGDPIAPEAAVSIEPAQDVIGTSFIEDNQNTTEDSSGGVGSNDTDVNGISDSSSIGRTAIGSLSAFHRPSDRTDLRAEFFWVNVPFSELNIDIRDRLDTCSPADSARLPHPIVTKFGPALNNIPSDDFGGALDAGEVITITSNAGTYASLVESIQDGYYLISQQNDPFSRAPDGLVADFPGSTAPDGFPAFENIALPDVAPLELSVDVDRRSISWTNSGAENGFVIVDIDFASIDNPMDRTPLACFLADDGFHRIADGLIPVSANSVPPFSFEGERTLVNTFQNEDTLLFMNSTTIGTIAQ